MTPVRPGDAKLFTTAAGTSHANLVRYETLSLTFGSELAIVHNSCMLLDSADSQHQLLT